MAASAMLRDADVDENLRMVSAVFAIVMIICGILGILGNVASIVVFAQREMRSSISILLIGLSWVDNLLIMLAIATFGVQGLSELFQNRGIEQYITFSSVSTYPITITLQTISVWLLVVITCERFLVVCHPFIARKFCTRRRARASLMLICAFAVVYNLIRFWEYRIEPAAEHGNESLPLMTEFLRQSEGYFVGYYTVLYIIVHFLFPFLILIFLNVNIIRTVHIARQERQKLTTQQSNEHRVAIMMIAIILVFAACNTVAFVLNIAESVRRDLFSNVHTLNVAFFAMDLSNTLIVVHCAVGCPIYYSFSQRYRRYFKILFCCQDWSKRQSSAIHSILSAALLPLRSADPDTYKPLTHNRYSNGLLAPTPPRTYSFQRLHTEPRGSDVSIPHLRSERTDTGNTMYTSKTDSSREYDDAKSTADADDYALRIPQNNSGEYITVTVL